MPPFEQSCNSETTTHVRPGETQGYFAPYPGRPSLEVCRPPPTPFEKLLIHVRKSM
jgi:hypothetical protein